MLKTVLHNVFSFAILLLQMLLAFQHCSVFAMKEDELRAEQQEEDRKVWSNCVTTNSSNGINKTCRCGASLHHAISCSADDGTLQIQHCSACTTTHLKIRLWQGTV